MRYLLGVSFAIVAISCSSALKRQSLISEDTTGPTTPRLFLEDFIPTGQLGIDLEAPELASTVEHLSGQLEAFCPEAGSSPGCEFLLPKNPERPRRGPAPARRRHLGPLTALGPSEVEEISKLPIRSQLAFFGSRPATDLIKFSTSLTGPSSPCHNGQIYLATSALLERNFPSQDVVNTARDLLTKGMSCNDDASLRAAHRLGFIALWQGQIPLAKEALLKTLDQENSSSERWKALYWLHKIGEAPSLSQSHRAKRKVAQSDPWNLGAYSPLSFYSIQMSLLDHPEGGAFPRDSEKLTIEPRHADDEIWNTFLRIVEHHLRAEDHKKARVLLDQLNFETIESRSSNSRLYLGYLANMSQSGLQTFRLLAPLTREGDKFSQHSVMKLLYPLWYFEEVQKIATSEGIDPWLIMALIRQESAFNPWARSPAGARGLMQLMPGTGRMYGIRDRNQLHNVEGNIQAGTRFLKRLLRDHEGNVELALAAYNAGPSNVTQWQRRYPADTELFVELMPFKETRDYVTSIMRNIYWYKHLYATEDVKAGEPPALQSQNQAPPDQRM